MTSRRTPLVLVDGYNVIRRVSRLKAAERAGGLGAGRDALLQEIRASGNVKRGRVEVIFDGAADGAPSTPSLHPNVRVSFSRPPQNADQALLARLQTLPEPEACTVVTADSDLAWEAKKLGARVVAPETWWTSLVPPPRRGIRPPPAPTKPQPTRAEIEWGLAAFGDKTIEVLPEKKKAPASPEPKPDRERTEKRKIKERRRARHRRRTRR